MSYILLAWLLAPIWLPVSWARRFLQQTPHRIAVFEIAGIGDVVCSAHLVSQLRQRYPQAIIDWIVDPVALSLGPALSMVDRVIPFAYAQQRGLLGRLRLAALCMRYDTAICLIPSSAQLVAFCFAAVPRRLSLLPASLNRSYALLEPLMSAVALHHTGAYFPETQAQLFQWLGVTKPNPQKKWQPVVSTLSQAGFSAQSDTILIGLLVGSGRALKRLTVEQLVEMVTGLLTTIEQADKIKVLLLGGAADTETAAAVLSGLPKSLHQSVVDLTGRYALAELPAALQRLRLLIGVDSGVTHIADALGVPVLCIAGPVDLAEVYQPGACRVRLVTSPPCYPCSTVFDTPAQCHTGTLACLNFDQQTLRHHVAAMLLADRECQ